MPKLKAPYLKWRDGRPRFEPGPSLRAKGIIGRDLKDQRGNWLRTRYEAAQAIASILEGDTEATGCAPTPRAPQPAQRTLSALADAYRASARFAERKPRTRAGYESHLRLMEKWAGDVPVASITRAAVSEFLRAVETHRGLATANAVYRTFKLLLYFGQHDLEWLEKNRAARMKRQSAPGRLVVWTQAEIAAFVAAADWCGLPAIGDAVLLGALTGQRLSDLLALPPLELQEGVFKLTQGKGGHTAFVPLTAPLRARMEAIARRWSTQWPNVRFTRQLIAANGKPYSGPKPFNDDFRTVQAVVCGALTGIEGLFCEPVSRNFPFVVSPGIAGKHFQDLRDTAVTWLYEATGGDMAQVCTITGHSLKTAHTIIDKHYFARRADTARAAGAQLEAYLARNMGG